MASFRRIRRSHADERSNNKQHSAVKHQQRRTEESVLLEDYDVGTDEWLCSASNNETHLHEIMKYQPSAEVVKALVERLKATTKNQVPEEVRDASGKTPLHMAVARGCNVSVVRLLLNGVGGVMPAMTKDSENRLPLHLACVRSERMLLKPSFKRDWLRRKRQQLHTDNDGGSVNNTNSVAVALLLMAAYPLAAALRDCHGDTPLDLARRNNADDRVVKALVARNAEANSYMRVEHADAPTKMDSVQAVGRAVLIGDPVPVEITESFSYDTDDLSSVGEEEFQWTNSNGETHVSQLLAI